MSKNKSVQNIESGKHHISGASKITALRIILFATSIILVLSFPQLNLAGPLGKALSFILNFLFGIGFYFLPVIIVVWATVGLPKKLNWIKILFLALFFISILGILQLIFESGGFLGEIIALLKYIFGFWASLILVTALTLICLIFSFEIRFYFGLFKSKDEVITPEIRGLDRFSEPEIGKQKDIKKQEPQKMRASAISPKDELDIDLNKIFTLNKFEDYKLPSLELLEPDSGLPNSGDIKNNALLIKKTLGNFGIEVEMAEINVGPTVTQYTLRPAQGTKLSKIVSLSNELSLALAVHPIRIEAPIPGQSLVGIEVPNRVSVKVRMRSLVATDDFIKSKYPLNVVLGRDVMGQEMYGDLGKMPHLLIAGATGSGKSIAIHSLIISLLYRNPPWILRLIMVDPKKVELSMYSGLPHLLLPPITDHRKVLVILKWLISEMDRRYELLLRAGHRDIQSFNESAVNSTKESIPYLVLIVDELADLMISHGREVEGAVIRLAQMARATGIHLVISTQRPSVDIITGLIKANITNRIALQVASQVDSRTILDMAGAEKLLGSGDMLYITPEISKPKRIQGAFVSEKEIKKVINFIRRQSDKLSDQKESFEEAVKPLELEELEETHGFVGELADDELYPEALKVVLEYKKASASLLQRRLRIGYARAARLLDLLEEKGVIGPGDGAKPREILVKDKNEGF